MAELVVRVRAQLRRRELDRASIAPLRVGALELDVVRHRVLVDCRIVDLTPSEFRVLLLLAREPERVFSRREIMEHLWESAYVGDERACDIHMLNLRRKLEDDPSNPARILTVRGIGYKLMPV
jgi:two-component system, OmpR family, response regulator MtrA